MNGYNRIGNGFKMVFFFNDLLEKEFEFDEVIYFLMVDIYYRERNWMWVVYMLDEILFKGLLLKLYVCEVLV